MAHFYDPWQLVFLVDLIVTVVGTVFVFTRFATRYFLGPDKLGYDDWILFAAWVLQAIRTVFLPLSYLPLFRQTTTIEDHLTQLNAQQEHMYETFFGISVGLGSIMEGACRAAIAAFLYRICTVTWQKTVILFLIIPFMLDSFVMATLCFYSFGSTANDPWNPTWWHTHGYSMVVVPAQAQFIWATILDFFFAAFPWVILHHVQIRKAKKRLICLSLSFGFLAGGAGIARVYKIMTYSAAEDALIIHIYSSVERGITFISISVPAFLPLWIIAGSNSRRFRARCSSTFTRIRGGERVHTKPHVDGGESGRKARWHGTRCQWDDDFEAIDELGLEVFPVDTMVTAPPTKPEDIPKVGILKSQTVTTHSHKAGCSALHGCEDCADYWPR